MTAATIAPVFVADAPTSITDLSSGPPSGEEWAVAVRVANKTTSALTYRLYLTTSADTTQSAGAYRAFDYSIDANDAVDVETRLTIPNGYKVQHKASATGLAVSVTGRKRAV